MKKIIVIVILLISSQLLNAQQLFSVFGGSYQTESMSVTHAAGEVIVGTQSNNDSFYTQGFIQPMMKSNIDTKSQDFKIKELALSLYPNPTSGILNIEGPDVYNAMVLVYDLGGNIVSSIKEHTSKKLLINLSHQAKGVYLIRVINGEKQLNRKVILK